MDEMLDTLINKHPAASVAESGRDHQMRITYG